MANYYEQSYTPLDTILGMKDLSDEERARLLGEGCLYVEAEIAEMLQALETTALEVLASIRTAQTRIRVGDRRNDDITYPVQESTEALHNQVFKLWYNNLDLTRFQIYATEVVDTMPADTKARFTKIYPPETQGEIGEAHAEIEA